MRYARIALLLALAIVMLSIGIMAMAAAAGIPSDRVLLALLGLYATLTGAGVLAVLLRLMTEGR